MVARYSTVTSTTQLAGLAAKNSVVVIDFHATWCGPCKVIAPVFEALAQKHASAGKVAFVKVDVDVAQPVAQKYSVRAMPTFIILAAGAEVDRIQGADRSSLTSAVERHVRNAKPKYSGTGHTLGAAHSPPAYVKDGHVMTTAPVMVCGANFLARLIAFVALYLISLFSIDAINAARGSRYAVEHHGGGGGGSGGGGPPGGPGRKLGGIDAVRRRECEGGSCG